MMKIAQITDLHIDDTLAKNFNVDARGRFERTLEKAKERGIETVVLTGDLGSAESHDWVFERVRSHGFDCSVILGNHDVLADYLKYDFIVPLVQGNGLYYRKQIEGFECLFLDSSSGEIDEVQLGWLENQLAKAESHILLFVHHPVFDCGDTNADRMYPLKKRDEVRNVLTGSGSQISMFCGHYHYKSAFVIREGGVGQFLTPSIFGQIKAYGEPGPEGDGYMAYREIILKDGQFRTEIIDI